LLWILQGKLFVAVVIIPISNHYQFHAHRV